MSETLCSEAQNSQSIIPSARAPRPLSEMRLVLNKGKINIPVGDARSRKHLRHAARAVVNDYEKEQSCFDFVTPRTLIQKLILLMRYSRYPARKFNQLKTGLAQAKKDQSFWQHWIHQVFEQAHKDTADRDTNRILVVRSLQSSRYPELLLDLVHRFEVKVICEWADMQPEPPTSLPKHHSASATETSKGARRKARRLRARQVIMTPVPWEQSDPPFIIAREKGFFGHETLHPTVLSHALVLGGTGCGKSQSVVMPIMKAMMDYTLADGTSMSMLVIDPKRELDAVVHNRIRQQSSPRMVTVIGQCPPVRYFDEDVARSPADKMAELRQLLGQKRKMDNNRYWHELADTMLTDFVRLEQDYLQKVNTSLLSAMVGDLLPGEIVPPGFWHRLQMLLDYSRTSPKNLKNASKTLDLFLEMGGVNSPSASVLKNYTADSELIQQWNYVLMSSDTLIKALTDADFCRAIDADPFPSIHRPHVNIQRVVDRGRIVLFQPGNSHGDTIAARALKARFYGAVFSRQQMQRPVGIIIDEAHRFITQDPSSGEQVLIDRCRSYRTNVVLATQSLRSLEHAMGSGMDAKDAVRILVSNTPTRWFMRSTEPDASELLRQLLPPPPTPGMHVADARPPSQLSPGEAYWLLSDGRWGRSRARLENIQ